MAYQSQILDVTNQTKWANKVPQGGVYWDPGTKSYFFRNADGRIQRTANLETAYTAAGIQQGTASDVVVAANQKFNLKGGQVQYDPKSQSYYFKDPATGQLLTTSNIATAYGILYPKTTTTSAVSTTNPSGLTATGETPESGFRPSGAGSQFFQPVYQPTYQNYAREGYSLMGDQSGLGALQAVLGQNTAGNISTYGVPMGDVGQYTQYKGALMGFGGLQAPRGIGQTANPFAINPMNYRAAYQTAMSQAQPNYGQFAGLGQLASPFTGGAQQTAYAQPSAYSTMSGIGSIQSPFGAAGSQGAFGGGFGGTSLYSRGR